MSADEEEPKSIRDRIKAFEGASTPTPPPANPTPKPKPKLKPSTPVSPEPPASTPVADAVAPSRSAGLKPEAASDTSVPIDVVVPAASPPAAPADDDGPAPPPPARPSLDTFQRSPGDTLVPPGPEATRDRTPPPMPSRASKPSPSPLPSPSPSPSPSPMLKPTPAAASASVDTALSPAPSPGAGTDAPPPPPRPALSASTSSASLSVRPSLRTSNSSTSLSGATTGPPVPRRPGTNVPAAGPVAPPLPPRDSSMASAQPPPARSSTVSYPPRRTGLASSTPALPSRSRTVAKGSMNRSRGSALLDSVEWDFSRQEDDQVDNHIQTLAQVPLDPAARDRYMHLFTSLAGGGKSVARSKAKEIFAYSKLEPSWIDRTIQFVGPDGGDLSASAFVKAMHVLDTELLERKFAVVDI